MNNLCVQCGRPSRRDLARGYCPVTARPIGKIRIESCKFFIDLDDGSSRRGRNSFKGSRRRDVR